MADNSSSSSDALMNFMNKQVDKSSSESGKGGRVNKTKQALEDSKTEKENAEQKEIDDAKKDSAFKASRYNQAAMKKRGVQDFLVMLPFIFFGLLALMIIAFKGGPVLKKAISSFFKGAIGG